MITTLLLAALCLQTPADRSFLPLDGVWEITTDHPTEKDARWYPVAVPASFETTLGFDHDGVASYRTWFFLPADFPGERLVLHFDGAATRAHVWLNGDLVGGHLGAWTAFRTDVTKLAVRGVENELVVMLEEKAGHYTDSHSPPLAPHFGGLWQSVALLGLPMPWIDDLNLLVHGDAERGTLVIDAPIRPSLRPDQHLVIESTIEGKHLRFTSRGDKRIEIPVENFALWDIDQPILYPVTLRLVGHGGREIDRHHTHVGFRTIAADGRTLRLNGRPLQVRALLDLGNYPPLLAPNASDRTIRTLIADARARGFNLVKFGQWLPPHRILDLFDEQGMLTWLEFPGCGRSNDDAQLEQWVDELREFLAHDQTHPSVILRSLAKTADSRRAADRMRSWIEQDPNWLPSHRIHDFYDDSPDDDASWREALDRLNRRLAERPPKPLLISTGTSADTWIDPSTVSGVGDEVPFWRPIDAAVQRDWRKRIATRFGAEATHDLVPHSLRYALNRRKDRIETLCGSVPGGGYVVAAARDSAVASSGLNDLQDRPKWRADEWDWHGDTMLLLGPDTPRCFRSGEPIRVPIRVAHHGKETIPPGRIAWQFGSEYGFLEHPLIPRGRVTDVGELELRARTDASPRELTLRASLAKPGETSARNRWSFWCVPTADGVADQTLRAEALTTDLLERLRGGARVLIHATDLPGSFATRDHRRLFGAPWFPPHPRLDAPHELVLDLTAFEIEPVGLLPLVGLIDQVRPLIGFWDTRGLRGVQEFAMAWETRVGEGRLLVSALPNDGSPASQYLHDLFHRHLATGPAPREALTEALIEQLEAELTSLGMDLTDAAWEFRPDREADGTAHEWRTIQIGDPEAALGRFQFDGWVSYRLDFEPPRYWVGESLFFQLPPPEAPYEVYFDSKRVGHRRPEDSDASLSPTATHRLRDSLQPGTHRLILRVEGTSGVSRLRGPLRLSTRPSGRVAGILVKPDHPQ